jgi:hypothetical protein
VARAQRLRSHERLDFRVDLGAPLVQEFLDGALFTACLVAALFFLRYWRIARDALFLYFSLAFVALATQWAWMGLDLTPTLPRHQAYLLRLVAFGLILVGIFKKNRRNRPN